MSSQEFRSYIAWPRDNSILVGEIDVASKQQNNERVNEQIAFDIETTEIGIEVEVQLLLMEELNQVKQHRGIKTPHKGLTLRTKTSLISYLSH